MHINNLTILDLITKELKRSNEIYPGFHSRHEAFGVLKEELEEALREVVKLGNGIIKDYWSNVIKHDHDNHDEVLKLLNKLQFQLLASANELIQVGAMIEKSRSLEQKEKKITGGSKK